VTAAAMATNFQPSEWIGASVRRSIIRAGVV
jgi:hypothetical protein